MSITIMIQSPSSSQSSWSHRRHSSSSSSSYWWSSPSSSLCHHHHSTHHNHHNNHFKIRLYQLPPPQQTQTHTQHHHPPRLPHPSIQKSIVYNIVSCHFPASVTLQTMSSSYLLPCVTLSAWHQHGFLYPKLSHASMYAMTWEVKTFAYHNHYKLLPW